MQVIAGLILVLFGLVSCVAIDEATADESSERRIVLDPQTMRDCEEGGGCVLITREKLRAYCFKSTT